MKKSSYSAYRILHEGAQTLAEMEHNGVRVDMEYLDDTVEEIAGQVEYLTERLKRSDVWKVWKRTFGDKANLGSRTQLATVLFDKMGFESTEETETGERSTNKKALEKIDHPFVPAYRKIEQLQDTATTFLLGPKREAVFHDGGWFVHPSYHLNTVATYRPSASDPNWKNVPKRDPEMAAFARRTYIPPPGFHFVEVDLAQIEVRVAVCYTDDPVMRRYVEDPTTDMHRDMAMQLFFLGEKEVDKHTARHGAKNMFVFPEFYGSVYFQCAPDMWDEMEKAGKPPWAVAGSDETIRDRLRRHGITRLGNCDPKAAPERGTFVAHVKDVENDFWNRRFKVHTAWKRRFYEDYLRRGYFEMLTGFVVNTPHSRNEVINYPIQGPAFHINLWACGQLVKWLRKYRMKSKMIGEVYDSFQAVVAPDELQDFLTKAHYLLTEGVRKHWPWITVPLDAEVEVSDVDEPWSRKRPWVRKNGVWRPKK